MADNKFPSLSSFLSSTKQIERNTLESALNTSTEQEVQKILSESSVRLSVYNQATKVTDAEEKESKSTADFIQQSVKEAVEVNASRVKSILDDVFSNVSITKEREEFWINKLCNLFNIDKNLPYEDRAALIEKQLAEDSDTLNYVTYLVESGENKA